MSLRALGVAIVGVLLAALASWVLFDERDATELGEAVPAAAPAPTIAAARSPALPPPPIPTAAADDAIPVASSSDWMRRFHESTDDFALARDLVGAAMQGNARAEYLLRGVLLRCEVQKRTLAPYAGASVAERVELYHATLPKAPEFARAKFRHQALRCARLFAEDPLDGYELPEEARDFRYWSARALESGDALAVMDRAYRLIVSRPPADDAAKDRAFREALIADVRVAVSSRDPGALFAVGGIFAHPSVVADPGDGYAWQIAACEEGHDCLLSKPDWGFGCVETGACLPGQTWLDNMQRDLGAAKYAELYAKAQDIRYKLATNDWEGLQQYLEIK